jgi:glutamyl/glutaminyl-tRNA synthetase
MQPPPASRQIPIIPGGLRTRFAPSPTGFLHLGHVASAIYVWGIARRAGAEIILRMEDHDQGRVRKEYERAILADLSWLGFHADRGVESVDKPSAFRQSDHWNRYEKALESIKAQTYRCNCSRKEILARSPQNSGELRYDGHCRSIDQGPNIRLCLANQPITFLDGIAGREEQNPALQCGDLLLKDRDGFWTYNFAVTVDDLHEDINLIIRGQDILSATARQIELRRILGSEANVHYLHHPLIWADESKKLSKRDHSTSIAQWREQGFNAAEIIGKAAFQVGLIERDEALDVNDLRSLFHE